MKRLIMSLATIFLLVNCGGRDFSDFDYSYITKDGNELWIAEKEDGEKILLSSNVLKINDFNQGKLFYTKKLDSSNAINYEVSISDLSNYQISDTLKIDSTLVRDSISTTMDSLVAENGNIIGENIIQYLELN